MPRKNLRSFPPGLWFHCLALSVIFCSTSFLNSAAIAEVILENWPGTLIEGYPEGWKETTNKPNTSTYVFGSQNGASIISIEGNVSIKKVLPRITIKRDEVMRWLWALEKSSTGSPGRDVGAGLPIFLITFEIQPKSTFGKLGQFIQRPYVLEYAWELSGQKYPYSRKLDPALQMVRRVGEGNGEIVGEEMNIYEDFTRLYNQEPDVITSVSISLNPSKSDVYVAKVGEIALRKASYLLNNIVYYSPTTLDVKPGTVVSRSLLGQAVPRVLGDIRLCGTKNDLPIFSSYYYGIKSSALEFAESALAEMIGSNRFGLGNSVKRPVLSPETYERHRILESELVSWVKRNLSIVQDKCAGLILDDLNIVTESAFIRRGTLHSAIKDEGIRETKQSFTDHYLILKTLPITLVVGQARLSDTELELGPGALSDQLVPLLLGNDDETDSRRLMRAFSDLFPTYTQLAVRFEEYYASVSGISNRIVSPRGISEDDLTSAESFREHLVYSNDTVPRKFRSWLSRTQGTHAIRDIHQSTDAFLTVLNNYLGSEDIVSTSEHHIKGINEEHGDEATAKLLRNMQALEHLYPQYVSSAETRSLLKSATFVLEKGFLEERRILNLGDKAFLSIVPRRDGIGKSTRSVFLTFDYMFDEKPVLGPSLTVQFRRRAPDSKEFDIAISGNPLLLRDYAAIRQLYLAYGGESPFPILVEGANQAFMVSQDKSWRPVLIKRSSLGCDIFTDAINGRKIESICVKNSSGSFGSFEEPKPTQPFLLTATGGDESCYLDDVWRARDSVTYYKYKVIPLGSDGADLKAIVCTDVDPFNTSEIATISPALDQLEENLKKTYSFFKSIGWRNKYHNKPLLEKIRVRGVFTAARQSLVNDQAAGTLTFRNANALSDLTMVAHEFSHLVLDSILRSNTSVDSCSQKAGLMYSSLEESIADTFAVLVNMGEPKPFVLGDDRSDYMIGKKALGDHARSLRRPNEGKGKYVNTDSPSEFKRKNSPQATNIDEKLLRRCWEKQDNETWQATDIAHINSGIPNMILGFAVERPMRDEWGLILYEGVMLMKSFSRNNYDRFVVTVMDEIEKIAKEAKDLNANRYWAEKLCQLEHGLKVTRLRALSCLDMD